MKYPETPNKDYLPQKISEHIRPHLSISNDQILRCPGDGNCFFTAFQLALDTPALALYEERHALGTQCRKDFLQWADKQMTGNTSLSCYEKEGFSVKDILLDTKFWQTPQEYIAGMSMDPVTERQWGGWAEALCLAYWHTVNVLIFEMSTNEENISLVCEPIGPPSPRKYVCLLMSVNHYDALLIPQADADTLTQRFGS